MAIDMKGLLYGLVIAYKLKVPFVPILKGDKIKERKLVLKSEDFLDYTDKTKSIEIFKSSLSRRDRILLIDDWFESGKTGRVAINLIESLQGKLVGISVIFNQLKKVDEEFFKKYNFHFLVRLPTR